MPLKSSQAIMGKRPAGIPAVLGIAPLTEDDLGTLAEARGVKPLPLQRLSDRHHKLAKAVASGRSTSECAIIAGIEPSRVSVLKGDPTFQDLVAYYRSEASRGDDLLHSNLNGLAFDAITELRRRLEEEPEGLTPVELERIAQLGLDRTGYGAKRTEEKSITVNFGDRLEAARKRVIEHSMKDVTPEAAE